jgi:hypothetical protein
VGDDLGLGVSVDSEDWDEVVPRYLDIFLTLRKGKWSEEDLKLPIHELSSKRRYGMLKPKGITR